MNQKPKICLTMIVRDEEAIIARCLNAARPFIDHWVIVDTGSKDRTPVIIEEMFKDVPGQLHHRVWKGFGDGKTAALEHAYAAMKDVPNSYALMLDADEILVGEFPTGLTHDRYGIWMQVNNLRYPNHRLFRLNRVWRYVGVLHEFPTSSEPWSEAIIEGLTITTPRDGARGKSPDRYADDAEVLEQALREIGDVNPSHPDYPLASRYRFYLAQSYRDAKNDRLAVANYLKRADMGGGLNWEEIYISLLQAGRAWSRLGNQIESDRTILRAHHTWADRAEALRDLAHVMNERLELAEPKQPVGSLFIEGAPARLEPTLPFPYYGPVEDGSTCTSLGFRMAQNRFAVPVLSYLIETGGFDQVIELGTHFGGLAALLALQCKMIGARFDTFDLKDNLLYAAELKEFGAEIHRLDVFSEDGQKVVREIIERSKRVLLLCDNGNKIEEVRTYAPMLRTGDVIGAHDYQPTGEFNAQRWQWQEVTDEALDPVCKSQGLGDYHQDLCTQAVWWMREKQ